MSAPVRIQLSRKKGWRMPPNTVKVTRPGKWGNPYWWEQKFWGLDFCLKLYRSTAQGIWLPSNFDGMPPHILHISYESHCKWMERHKKNGTWHPAEAMRTELRGKNLACWCPIGAPCHGDILLELSNRNT